MSYEYSEDALMEQATQDVLEELGWTVISARKKNIFITQKINETN